MQTELSTRLFKNRVTELKAMDSICAVVHFLLIIQPKGRPYRNTQTTTYQDFDFIFLNWISSDVANSETNAVRKERKKEKKRPTNLFKFKLNYSLICINCLCQMQQPLAATWILTKSLTF